MSWVQSPLSLTSLPLFQFTKNISKLRVALTDPCLIFSSIVWFLVTFVSFFNFVISNKNFLGVLKNLKFRKKKIVKSLTLVNELDNVNFLFMFVYLIFLKWVQKWSKGLSEVIKKLIN